MTPGGGSKPLLFAQSSPDDFDEPTIADEEYNHYRNSNIKFDNSA